MWFQMISIQMPVYVTSDVFMKKVISSGSKIQFKSKHFVESNIIRRAELSLVNSMELDSIDKKI